LHILIGQTIFPVSDTSPMGTPTLEQTKIELVRVQSMLRMLEGNTAPNDIRRLEQAWLWPILARLEDTEREYQPPPRAE
jgi:hypothetical protein